MTEPTKPLRRRRDARGFPVVEPMPAKKSDDEKRDERSKPMERMG